MIYLIGGPPRCGKTTLARTFAEKNKIPFFSIDHISSMISPYIPENQQENSFPLRTARRNANNSNDLFHERYTHEEIVNFYFTQAATIWPGIKNFIEYGIRDHHDFILEGWQIFPEFLKEINKAYTDRSLKILFLYVKNLVF